LGLGLGQGLETKKIHFITYGDNNYRNSKIRISEEAEDVGWFHSIQSYGPEDLDDMFKERFKDILKQPRIAGYGIWRPYIIKKINEIKDGDYLVYLDAGCTINKKGEKRFYEYIVMLNNNDEGIISFQMPHLDKVWTIKEIFHYFNLDINGKIANEGQILDGILIMKKIKI